MRTCSKAVLKGYAVFILVGLAMLVYPKLSNADEVYTADNKLYMKLDPEIGGYVVLETDRCEIESKKEEYSYRAYIENKFGQTRRACWYRAEPPSAYHSPLVLVVEEMEYNGKIIYNVGSFGQYYFKPTKE